MAAPAKWLFGAVPRFSAGLRAAALRSHEVYILSSRYGLVDPEKVIEPYDENIESIDPVALHSWRSDMVQTFATWAERGHSVVVYGDKKIRMLFAGMTEAAFEDIMSPSSPELPFDECYASHHIIAKEGAEWPSEWVLEYIQTTPGTTGDKIREVMTQKGFPTTTGYAQIRRLLSCPIIRVDSEGRIWPRHESNYVPGGETSDMVTARNPQTIAAAYAAGFFDAVGRVECRPSQEDPDSLYLAVFATTTDEPSAVSMRDKFGGRVNKVSGLGKGDGLHTDNWEWRATAHRAAAFLELALPYLAAKREKAESVLREWRDSLNGGESEGEIFRR